MLSIYVPTTCCVPTLCDATTYLGYGNSTENKLIVCIRYFMAMIAIDFSYSPVSGAGRGRVCFLHRLMKNHTDWTPNSSCLLLLITTQKIVEIVEILEPLVLI